jgi:hypothetical protein
MTTTGWILMIVSWSAILALFIYCLAKVMTTNQKRD